MSDVCVITGGGSGMGLAAAKNMNRITCIDHGSCHIAQTNRTGITFRKMSESNDRYSLLIHTVSLTFYSFVAANQALIAL